MYGPVTVSFSSRLGICRECMKCQTCELRVQMDVNPVLPRIMTWLQSPVLLQLPSDWHLLPAVIQALLTCC